VGLDTQPGGERLRNGEDWVETAAHTGESPLMSILAVEQPPLVSHFLKCMPAVALAHTGEVPVISVEAVEKAG
jgi:hypothetical protein